jgi:adenine-specific DNA-methyltransferase
MSNKGDLVADFYCGSGTTLVVAKELSRNYIGCDISEVAISLAQERLASVNNN